MSGHRTVINIFIARVIVFTLQLVISLLGSNIMLNALKRAHKIVIELLT